MRILGIDHGDKNIGLAISDRLQLTAQNLALYRSINKTEDLKYFRALIERYEVEKIVVGLPLNMDGTCGPSADKVKKFAAWLEKNLRLPVLLWDERLTSQQAFRILREKNVSIAQKKKTKDQVSANIILAGYLESIRV